MIGGPQEIQFSTNFNMRIAQIHYNNRVQCKSIHPIQENTFLGKHHADTIYFRFSDNENTSSDEYYTLSYILNNLCIEKSYLVYIIVGIVVIVVFLLLLIIIGICLCVKRRREARKLTIVEPDGRTYRETQIVMQIENHGLLKTDL